MKFSQLSSLFDPRVLERGETYWHEGRVEAASQIVPGVFHGEVRGNDLYDVTVRVDAKGRFVSASCTCPFAASGNRCKHLAAVMLALEDDGLGKGTVRGIDGCPVSITAPLDDAPGPISLDAYRAVRAYFASWFGEASGSGPLLIWDPRIAEECPNPGGTKFPTLSLQQAGRMAENSVQAALEAGDDDNWGSDDWDDWGEEDGDDDDWHGGDVANTVVASAFAGANDVLDNALAADDYGAAMRNAIAVMRIADDALEYLDSFVDTDEYVERLGWKVRLLMEKASRDAGADPAMLNSMAGALVDAIRGGADAGCGVARCSMAPALLSFSAHPRTRRIADEALSSLESSAAQGDDPRGWRSLLCALRHDDLLLAREYGQVQRYELDHLDDGMMAKFAVARAALADDYERVRELARRHMKNTSEAETWRDFEVLPDATFPYGWTTALIAAAQRLGDREDLERLYKDVIVQGGVRSSWIAGATIEDDKKCVGRLRALAGSHRWRERTLPDIIARCREGNDENRVYEYLLRSEGLVAEALDYCARVPGAIDRLYDFVAAVQPNSATELLLKPYGGDRAFVGTVPRAEYHKAADRLRRTVPFMGGAWAAEYARSLVARYPRRANLKAALRGLL
ncbi:SWIM zinc finger family protein [Bifidobacterium vespertilionis]|uniref:SWIM zinc finger family protein n=1 Tax=Bifidobacterium vespertilionis TaxID=2562524 RepID=UPI001BDBDFC8|nr:SWIM zinc finger family protein [Bifidobacterium vespertilionis]MBT1180082.1 SWIM zinc finger family protein [Bifidobacterium vespertilionis]